MATFIISLIIGIYIGIPCESSSRINAYLGIKTKFSLRGFLAGFIFVFLLVCLPVTIISWLISRNIGFIPYLPAVGMGLFFGYIFNFLSSRYNPSGYNKTETHAWHYVGRGGKRGAYVRPATERDVYEHKQSYGSWEKKVEVERKIIPYMLYFLSYIALWILLGSWEVLIGLTVGYLVFEICLKGLKQFLNACREAL